MNVDSTYRASLAASLGLWYGTPQIVSLTGGVWQRLVIGDPMRASISFFYGDGIITRVSGVVIWPNKNSGAGLGITIPPQGLTLLRSVHGDLVAGDWYGWGIVPAKIAVLPEQWRG